jgi:hypothetical protein
MRLVKKLKRPKEWSVLQACRNGCAETIVSWAITIIAATKNGDDPAARRDADRRAVTVKELAERFEKEHIDLRLKPSTAKGIVTLLGLSAGICGRKCPA